MTPTTSAGKLTAIIYALFGIPSAMALVMLVGDIISQLNNFVLKFIGTKLLRQGRVKVTNAKRAIFILLLYCIKLLLGSAFVMIMASKELSFVDSIYLTFQTITTIGYGYMAWNSNQSVIRLVFPFVVSVVGMGLVASFYSQGDNKTEQNENEPSQTENNHSKSTYDNNGFLDENELNLDQYKDAP